MVDENEEIIDIEEVKSTLLKKLNYLRKLGLILTKVGICSIGYASSFTLASVPLNENVLNNLQNIGVTTLSILNFISSSLVVKNIKKERNVYLKGLDKDKKIDFENFNINDVYKENRNIILLSFLYGITSITMNGLIDVCELEEIKHNLMMMFGTINTMSVILFLYGTCFLGNIDEYFEKVYKK